MINLIVYEYYRETIKNTLTGVFVAGLCLLITILYSFYDYESSRLKPFEQFQNKKGFAGFYLKDYDADSEFYEWEIDINNYSEIEKIYRTSKTRLMLGNKSAETYVYDENIWNNWRGRLRAGRWFTEMDVKSNYLEVILGGDTRGHKVGDYIEMYGGVEAKIVGILQENSEIFCDDQGYSGLKFNYSWMYKVPPYIEGTCFAIVQKETMDRLGVEYGEMSNFMVLVYKDDISEETLHEYQVAFNKNSGYSLEKFMEKSENYGRQKILTYVPSMIVAVVMLILAIYCLSYIKIKKSNKIYSVYYLNGASKAKIYGIVIGYVVLLIMVSIAAFFVLGAWFDFYARAHNILYSFWTSSLLYPALLYLFLGLFMSLSMIFEMRGKSAYDFVRETMEV